MALEIDADKKEELKDYLYKYWPDTIEIICGGLSGKTFGKEHNVRLFTDRWPNATTVILTFNEGTVKWVFTFSVDAAITVSTLNTPGIINDKEVATICGSNELIEKLMNEVTSDPLFMGPKFSKSPELFKYIYSPQSPLEKSPLPEGYKLGSIPVADIDFIWSKWIPCNGLKPLMQHFITSLPNFAIYDTTVEPPQLVSWIVTSGMGTLHHLYTLEEHRGKGLGKRLVQELTQRILSEGMTPFVYAEYDNIPPQSLFTKCGYVRSGSNVVFLNAL